MKKITLLAAAGIIVFCIVPIATIQAMPQQIQRNENVVSGQLNESQSFFNQKELRDNVHTYGNQEFRATMMAQGDTKNPYVKRRGSNEPDEKHQGPGYPHVMRRGNGRSTMRDKMAADNNSDVANDENEVFGDDSSAKSNKDLENSSGYNEDL